MKVLSVKVRGRKKILLDWGTLPSLAIQHFYSNGVVTTSQSPQGVKEVEITIYPYGVKYHEKYWTIQGSNDPATSRSFVFSYDSKNIILPVIEVLRSLLAPNSFLLYRLFESNSFPQFFTETYEPNKVHLRFTSQYEFWEGKFNFAVLLNQLNYGFTVCYMDNKNKLAEIEIVTDRTNGGVLYRLSSDLVKHLLYSPTLTEEDIDLKWDRNNPAHLEIPIRWFS